MLSCVAVTMCLLFF